MSPLFFNCDAGYAARGKRERKAFLCDFYSVKGSRLDIFGRLKGVESVHLICEYFSVDRGSLRADKYSVDILRVGAGKVAHG